MLGDASHGIGKEGPGHNSAGVNPRIDEGHADEVLARIFWDGDGGGLARVAVDPRAISNLDFWSGEAEIL